MFDDHFGLARAVLEGRKTMTRRTITGITPEDSEYLENAFDWELRESVIIDRYARFKPGEVVAVAQSYREIEKEIMREGLPLTIKDSLLKSPGYRNKMFVRADLMPHQIRITSVRIEHIQDISDEDCIKEGIEEDAPYYWVPINRGLPDWRKLNEAVSDMYPNLDGKVSPHFWDSPKKAFAALIKKMAGKKAWDDNPWVFVYGFELVK